MSDRQTHIIRRQILEVDVSNEEEHWQWQERLSRFFRETFVPQLESLLDRHSVPGEVIRLDKLEVTADMSTGKNWNKLLLDDLLRKVEDALPLSPDENAGQGSTVNISAVENRLEQFFFFLKNGHLPWNATAALKGNFEDEILKTLEQLDKRVVAGWSEQFAKMLKTEAVRRRLALQFDTSFAVNLLRAFFPDNADELSRSRTLADALAREAGLTGHAFDTAFREAALTGGAGGMDQPLLMETVRRFLKKHPGKTPGVIEHLFNPDKKYAAPLNIPAPAGPDALALKDWLMSDPSRFQRWAALSPAERKVSVKSFDPGEMSSRLDKKVHSSGGRLNTEEDIQFGGTPGSSDLFYIDNAGLVLLHPFLTAFFEELNVVKKGRMLKPQRAVHLLQYLATGQTATPEFELPLNKVLCGIPTSEPLEAGIRLAKKEKTEAKHLLEAVIRHWNVLKNTSPEGLQGTYLCREGKLSRRGSDDWQLQVEQKGFDVLLADLPWGFSMIKLPWMEGVLWVEWQ